ncbi:MAG TPA: PhoH family protein [Phycisphaerales bacterium]|nr:PhoH family protein [Phycisphaerales bacterium]
MPQAPTKEIHDQTKDRAAENDPGSERTKYFVLDTNVLLHNPNALFVFEDNNVVIPYPVIEELDTMKRREDDIGRSARQCIRHLDRLRSIGKLTEGVHWGELPTTQEFNPSAFLANGKAGTIQVDVTDPARPAAISKDMPDNHIIAVAYALKLAGEPAVFVSKDLSARIKSDALGIKTEDFENQKVDAEKLYSGYLDLTIPGKLIDDLYHDKQLDMEKLEPYLTTEMPDGSTTTKSILTNQFAVLHDQDDENHTGLARRLAGRLAETESLIPVTGPRKPIFGILARNVQQTMALDLLLDDEIRLVTLLGSAGTGKTLLALAAGMSKVFKDERYDKLLVARPIMPMGRDIGYLPGDKDEKLTAWMQPIFDNLSYLLSTRGSHHDQADSHSTEQRIEQLTAGGQLVLEPLTYIRGRSIPHQFMIVDEAQNLTPHEIKTIISRVGEDTKIVLTGDIGQIDNPYLDRASNGLSYAVEKMKSIGIVGHVTLARSERSELASMAAKLL